VITLQAAAMPNEHKASTALQKLGLPHTLRVLEPTKNRQKTSACLAIFPNSHMLAGDCSIADIANGAWVRTRRWPEPGQIRQPS
jgi:glutathione S-transferase